ncbi:lipocalin family protein [Pseudogemmobacter sonorensis]|uniref:lipocalin family protein n=1 Tax=Pseudogemmobacter sonorensis TaxID=2989681 RepID=UPI0036CEC039
MGCWLALGLLAACAAAPGASVAVFRPEAAPIWSAAAFLPARIEGDWRQAAAYASGERPGCAPGAVEFRQGAEGLFLRARLCLDGREVSLSGPVGIVGPGRLSVPGMEDWWVIWVDESYRTLAIATPSGRFGFVLDRGSLPPDRRAAAAEIFAFNGYSKARLRPF